MDIGHAAVAVATGCCYLLVIFSTFRIVVAVDITAAGEGDSGNYKN